MGDGNNTYTYMLKDDKRNKCIKKKRTRKLLIFHTNERMDLSKFQEMPKKKKPVIKKMLTEWGDSSCGKALAIQA